MQTSIDARVVRVVQDLQALKGHWQEIADKGGVSKRTLEKVAYGVSKDPRNRTLTKIETGIERFRTITRRRVS